MLLEASASLFGATWSRFEASLPEGRKGTQQCAPSPRIALPERRSKELAKHEGHRGSEAAYAQPPVGISMDGKGRKQPN